MTTTLISPVTEAGRSPRSRRRRLRAETDAAIERAQEAFAGWRAVAPGERARLLRAFAAVVDAHIEELARLEVAQRRAHHRQRALGGRQRPRLPELLQRRAGAALRPADPGAPAAST